jgi:hypothetical protein
VESCTLRRSTESGSVANSNRNKERLWLEINATKQTWMRFLHALAPDIQDSEEAVYASVDYVFQVSGEYTVNFSILTLGSPTTIAKLLRKIDQLEREGDDKSKCSINHV